MKKDFYGSVYFGLGLTLLTGLFQSWLHFQAGIDIYTLSSFRNWFLAMNFISFITSVLILIYYHHKNYKATFWTGLFATLTTFASLLYLFSATLYPIFRKHPDIFVFIGVIVNLIYATSLLVSKASLRPWLKRAGLVSVILCLAHLITLGWFMYSPPYPVKPAMDLVRQWLFLAERIVPALFLLNFIEENQSAVPDPGNIAPNDRYLVFKVMLAILTIYSLLLSLVLVRENYDLTHISARQNTLAQPFEKGIFINSRSDTLFYRLLKPLNYDPQKEYPLVVALPYSCWQDNTRQIDACPMARWLSADSNRIKFPAFVFVPRCPPQTGWGGVSNTPSIAALAIEAIVALNKTYSIDTQKRYISGVSRGGYGSWQMIATNPGLFAAAVPVCGEGKPDEAKNMIPVSIWAFHGAKDVNVPVSGSRDMISAIKKAGGSPRYTEYPNGGHDVWEDVVKTPGLLDWLFAQTQGDSAKTTRM
jgi:hypothetical protein